MNIPTTDRGKYDKKSENNFNKFNKNEINEDIHTENKDHTVIEFNRFDIDKNDDEKNIHNKKYNQNTIINNNVENLYCFPHKNLHFITDEYQDIETSETDTPVSENLIVLDMVAHTPYPSQSCKPSNRTHLNTASKINSIDMQYKSPSKFFSEISNLNLFNFHDFIPKLSNSTSLTPAPLISTPIATSSSCISKLKPLSGKNDSQINKNNCVSKDNRSHSKSQIEITDLKNYGSSELDVSPHIMPTNINSNDFYKINVSTTDKINNFFSSLFNPTYLPTSNSNFVRKLDLDLLNHDDLSEKVSLYENIMNIRDDHDNVNVMTDDVVLGEFQRTDCDIKAVSTCPMQ
jgi:hypothetical protein